MANEFKVRKGLIVNGSGSTILDIQGSQGQLFSVTDQLSGSLFSVNDISGVPIMEVFSDNTVNIGQYLSEAIKISGSFARVTGSLFGTASWATNFVTSSVTSASYAFTASSAVSAFTASSAVNATNALTASSADNFNVRQSITASAALINGTITAQTLVVSTVSSSVIFSSGSNIFGNSTANTQTFTGSVNITGSLNLTGRATLNDLTGSLFGTSSWAQNFITSSVTSASYAFTASSAVSASYVLNAISSSFAFTASSAVNSFNTVTASHALTASSADNFLVRNNAIVSGSFTVFTGSAIELQVTNTGVKMGNMLTDSINATGSFRVSGSANVLGSGSAVFTVDGTSGRLFQVDDSLSGSLFSVNTAAGLPIIEAFSDNTVRIGQYGQRALFVSQSRVGIGKEGPMNATLDVSGSMVVTGSFGVSGRATITDLTGSLFGTASWATNFVTSSVTSASYAFTASSAVSAFTASSAVNSTNALTASSADNFVVRQSLTASSALVNGTITAQTLVVSTISSSVTYSSGSNVFGNSTANTQTFTGSVNITGSLTLTGRGTINDLTGSLFGTASWALNSNTASYVLPSAIAGNLSQIATGSVTASVDVIDTAIFKLTSGSKNIVTVKSDTIVGYIGVNNGNPSYMLDVSGSSRFIGGGNLTTITRTTDTLGYAAFVLGNSGNADAGGLKLWGTNYTETGLIRRNGTYLYSSDPGGLTLNAEGSTNSIFIATNSATRMFFSASGLVGVNTTTPSSSFDVSGSGRYTNGLSVTGSLRAPEITGSLFGTASWALNVVGGGGGGSAFPFTGSAQITGSLGITGSFAIGGNITATSGSSYLIVSHSLIQPSQTGSQIFDVNITPTFTYTAPNQTQTALRVRATFTGSSNLTSSQANVIADFGATSVGSQFLVNDVTSGSIYMVNDVSGLPIIEANSNWDVFIYDYPSTVFKKTGSVLELGVQGNPSSSVLIKSDIVVNEGMAFSYTSSQATGSTVGAVTSSLYSVRFSNTSASVYIHAIVTGYDTGSRDTITGDIKGTVRYRSGVATVVGVDQTFINSDAQVVNFDIVAGGTSGSLLVYGTGSRAYQWGATVVTQVI